MSVSTMPARPIGETRSDAFATLQRHYAEPMLAAKAAHAAGTGVIGLAGPTAPVELILAAGRFPVRIAADIARPTPAADLFMEEEMESEDRARLEAALQGEYKFLDLLVLTRRDDMLYYFLKELHRIGEAPDAPDLFLFDLMGRRHDVARTYNFDNVALLIATLERVVGHEITDSAVRDAIVLTNRSRGLQRRLLDLRWAGKLRGTDALQAIGAGAFMHPSAYADALEGYIAEIEAAPTPALAGPRILVATSEPLSHVALHRRLEGAGALVVAEDDAWGSRAPGDDAGLAGSAREAIFQKYWLDTAHGDVEPREARQAWFMAQIAREDLDGVVFYVPPSDHKFGWDYPALAAAVEARGKPSVLLRQDATRDDMIDAPIEAFVAQLRA